MKPYKKAGRTIIPNKTNIISNKYSTFLNQDDMISNKKDDINSKKDIIFNKHYDMNSNKHYDMNSNKHYDMNSNKHYDMNSNISNKQTMLLEPFSNEFLDNSLAEDSILIQNSTVNEITDDLFSFYLLNNLNQTRILLDFFHLFLVQNNKDYIVFMEYQNLWTKMIQKLLDESSIQYKKNVKNGGCLLKDYNLEDAVQLARHIQHHEAYHDFKKDIRQELEKLTNFFFLKENQLNSDNTFYEFLKNERNPSEWDLSIAGLKYLKDNCPIDFYQLDIIRCIKTKHRKDLFSENITAEEGSHVFSIANKQKRKKEGGTKFTRLKDFSTRNLKMNPKKVEKVKKTQKFKKNERSQKTRNKQKTRNTQKTRNKKTIKLANREKENTDDKEEEESSTYFLLRPNLNDKIKPIYNMNQIHCNIRDAPIKLQLLMPVFMHSDPNPNENANIFSYEQVINFLDKIKTVVTLANLLDPANSPSVEPTNFNTKQFLKKENSVEMKRIGVVQHLLNLNTNHSAGIINRFAETLDTICKMFGSKLKTKKVSDEEVEMDKIFITNILNTKSIDQILDEINILFPVLNKTNFDKNKHPIYLETNFSGKYDSVVITFQNKENKLTIPFDSFQISKIKNHIGGDEMKSLNEYAELIISGIPNAPSKANNAKYSLLKNQIILAFKARGDGNQVIYKKLLNDYFKDIQKGITNQENKKFFNVFFDSFIGTNDKNTFTQAILSHSDHSPVYCIRGGGGIRPTLSLTELFETFYEKDKFMRLIQNGSPNFADYYYYEGDTSNQIISYKEDIHYRKNIETGDTLCIYIKKESNNIYKCIYKILKNISDDQVEKLVDPGTPEILFNEVKEELQQDLIRSGVQNIFIDEYNNFDDVLKKLIEIEYAKTFFEGNDLSEKINILTNLMINQLNTVVYIITHEMRLDYFPNLNQRKQIGNNGLKLNQSFFNILNDFIVKAIDFINIQMKEMKDLKDTYEKFLTGKFKKLDKKTVEKKINDMNTILKNAQEKIKESLQNYKPDEMKVSLRKRKEIKDRSELFDSLGLNKIDTRDASELAKVVKEGLIKLDDLIQNKIQETKIKKNTKKRKFGP